MSFIPCIQKVPVLNISFDEFWIRANQLLEALLRLIFIFESKIVYKAFQEETAWSIDFLLECGENLKVYFNLLLFFRRYLSLRFLRHRLDHALVNHIKDVVEELVVVKEFPYLS